MTSVVRKREETRVLLRSVLLPYKRGLLLTELEREYRGMTGSNISYRMLGYPSLQSLIQDMQDVATLQVLDSGHQVVFATPDKSTEHIASMVSCQKDNVEGYNRYTSRVLSGQSTIAKTMTMTDYPSRLVVSTDGTVSPLVKQKLGMLLSKFPMGLFASELRERYRQLHGEDIDPLSCGQSSLLELCCQVPDILHMEKVDQGRDWLLVPTKSVLCGYTTDRASYEKSKVSSDSTEMSSFSVQSDNLDYLKLPETVAVGDHVRVVVTGIQSPGKVFVQLADMHDELVSIMEIISKEMQEGEERGVRPMEVREGMVVACMINTTWYRVMVVKVKDMTRVKVFLTDYGIVQTVDMLGLRYLSMHTTLYPAQAIPVSLALPDGRNSWPKGTGTRLKQIMIKNQDQGGFVLAKVAKLREQHSKMVVWLTDHNNVVINDVLAYDGTEGEFTDRQSRFLKSLADVKELAAKVLEKNVSDEMLERLEGLLGDLEIELSSDNNNCRVLKTVVEDKILHIVSVEGRRWCVSEEIADMIKDDWRRGDLLDKMVERRRMGVDRLVILRKTEEDLWEEMIGMGVVGTSSEFVSLYLLADVPRIVGAFALAGTVEGKVEMLETIITKMR